VCLDTFLFAVKNIEGTVSDGKASGYCDAYAVSFFDV
jgi:hypothetical protein